MYPKSMVKSFYFILQSSPKSDHVKEDELNRIYSTGGGKKKCIQNFGQETEFKNTTYKTKI